MSKLRSYEIAVHVVVEAHSAAEAKAEVHKRLRGMWDSLPKSAGWIGYLVDEKVAREKAERREAD